LALTSLHGYLIASRSVLHRLGPPARQASPTSGRGQLAVCVLSAIFVQDVARCTADGRHDPDNLGRLPGYWLREATQHDGNLDTPR